VHEICAQAGALLILDEVMMFRLGFHGAQGLFGVSPDLTLLGKVIGGGLPVGAVGGRADVMSVFDVTLPRSIRHSGTYNANPMTATAGLVCLEHLSPEHFTRMRRAAEGLVEAATRILRDHRIPASLAHTESMFNLHGLPVAATTYSELQRQDRDLARVLHLGLLNAGLQLTPTGMGSMSTVMTDAHVTALVDGLLYVVKRYLH
jgi:glutamate-1-semialdehyde 2,1-aminomutase